MCACVHCMSVSLPRRATVAKLFFVCRKRKEDGPAIYSVIVTPWIVVWNVIECLAHSTLEWDRCVVLCSHRCCGWVCLRGFSNSYAGKGPIQVANTPFFSAGANTPFVSKYKPFLRFHHGCI